MSIGIYKITNLINNKVYIGQSVNIEKRWKKHLYALELNKHINNHLQNAWNKYGKENFKFEILELCSQKDLNNKETYWKEYYDKISGTYNIGHTGNVKTMSNEQKQKISISEKGKKLSNETKLKIKEKRKYQIITELHKLHIKESVLKKHIKRTQKEKEFLSKIHKGKKHTEETKLKISKNNKMKGIHNYRKWIHKNGIVKFVKPEELNYYLQNGWFKGIKDIKN